MAVGAAGVTRNAYQGLGLIGGSSSGAIVIAMLARSSIVQDASAPAGKFVSTANRLLAQRAFSEILAGNGATAGGSCCAVQAKSRKLPARAPRKFLVIPSSPLPAYSLQSLRGKDCSELLLDLHAELSTPGTVQGTIEPEELVGKRRRRIEDVVEAELDPGLIERGIVFDSVAD